MLQMRSELVLRGEDLESVWYLLQRHAFETAGQLHINYDDFSQVRDSAPRLLARLCREGLLLWLLRG
jgi:hypothetical protein